jgi:hypothetical protein
MPNSDDAPIQESKSKLRKISDYLNHPFMIALVTFLLSDIVATGFAKWLDHLSQARELSTTLRTHATDSIKDITDIFYERMTRGALLASAIRRKVSEQDFTERERAYDKIYVKYNSVLQSQIFRFNEFLNSQYAVFDINNDEISLKLPSRLFTLIDQCLTRAVDSYLSNNQNRRDQAPDLLSKCATDSGEVATIIELNSHLQDCIHEYSLNLYKISSFEGSEDAF